MPLQASRSAPEKNPHAAGIGRAVNFKQKVSAARFRIGRFASGRGLFLAVLVGPGGRRGRTLFGLCLVACLASGCGLFGRMVFTALGVFGVLRHFRSLGHAAE